MMATQFVYDESLEQHLEGPRFDATKRSSGETRLAAFKMAEAV